MPALADLEPVRVLLDRWSVLISAYVGVPPADVLDLPWWQLEQSIEIAEHRMGVEVRG